MSCAVNTSGQANFSTNHIQDEEVKRGHKPLTSFFINDILSSSGAGRRDDSYNGDKKQLRSSSSSPPASDNEDEDRSAGRRDFSADSCDNNDCDSVVAFGHQRPLIDFHSLHQQLFRFHHHNQQHHHRHLHHPQHQTHQHQQQFFLAQQSSFLASRFERARDLVVEVSRNSIPHPTNHQNRHQQQDCRNTDTAAAKLPRRSPPRQRLVKRGTGSPLDIKRPWDEEERSRSKSPDRVSDDVIKSDEEIEVDVSSYETDDDDVTTPGQPISDKGGVCPLDALLKMTSQTFEQDICDDGSNNSSSVNGNGSSTKHGNGGSGGGSNGGGSGKKRRKSRTAFTNKQIFELEKRFVYQKYLTPVDRDDIAQSLGLTNAQVITWFQNRRAKLKRDMEELKADVIAAKALGKEPVASVLIGGIEELLQGTRDALRKKPPQKSGGFHLVGNCTSTASHERRHFEQVFDAARKPGPPVSCNNNPASNWSGRHHVVRPEQSEKENSDVSSVKSDDVMK